MKTTINFLSFDGTSKSFAIVGEQKIMIGRSERSDFVTMDGEMSGEHFSLHHSQGKLIVLDNNSKNGTFLNGIKIEEAEFFIGDELFAGRCKFFINDKDLTKVQKETLSFPGTFQNSADKNLSTEFTGVREKNKTSSHLSVLPPSKEELPLVSIHHAQEVQIRKRAKTKIRMSKDEVKLNHSYRMVISHVIDTLYFILFFSLPFAAFSWFENKKVIYFGSSQFQYIDYHEKRVLYASLMGLFSGLLAHFLNKQHRFTIGERWAGIEGLYKRQ